MIDAHQLRHFVVRTTLQHIGLWSQSAEDLVMGTAAHESKLGTYLRQLGGGPALGIFQMEPATHNDIWENYILLRPNLAKYLGFASTPNPQEMIWNLRYATAMCRIHYRRFPDSLPMAGDVQGYAELWKKRYNTELGAGTVEQFVEAYKLVDVS